MERVSFCKFSGSGNDFIIIDNREHRIDAVQLTPFIAKVCNRRMSVGADGLILVEEGTGVDFRWRYFNSDGSLADMCGNGARCVARFAYLNGIAGTSMSFENQTVVVSAEIKDQRVKINMPDPVDFRADYTLDVDGEPVTVSSINTGVPHVLIRVKNRDALNHVDVIGRGKEIRFHRDYAPEGTNVNYITPLEDNGIVIRTYERGVEDETLACGTGAIAAALVTARQSGVDSPISVTTRSGGRLDITFLENEGRFSDIHLEGDARMIYRGELSTDAWMY